jgi:hypothetical protein
MKNARGLKYKRVTCFIINRNTLLHVSTLLGHLQGELFCYRNTKVALYS